MLRNLRKKIKKKEQRLRKLTQKIVDKEAQIRRSDPHCGCLCFVMLSSSTTRDKILRSFKDKFGNRIMFLFGLNRRTPRYWIREAPKPANINWKNFSIPKLKAIAVRILTYSLLISLVYGALISLEFMIRKIQDDLPLSQNEEPKHIEGSLAFYIFFETFQFSATLMTQIVCHIFDISFVKIEVILNQGISLGFLKVLPLFPLHKILVLDPSINHPKSFVVSGFLVILTQSFLKPIMKVFSLSSVISIIKIIWMRIRFSVGARPLMTQEELNKIFTKPKCNLKNLYCEDIYITTIAFMTSSYNPGVTVACLVYFILKTFADRFLFLRFYAEPEVDSIELSRHYFRLFRFLIAITAFQAALRSISIDFPDVSFDGFDISRLAYYGVLTTFWVILFFPYELAIEYISRRVEKKHLVSRTEKSEELLSLDQKEEESGEEGKVILPIREYYKGVSDLIEQIRSESISAHSQHEFSERLFSKGITAD